MYFSQGKTEQKNHYYFYYKHKTNEKMLAQTTPYLLGGCPRIASLPRKELKIFSDILKSKT